MAILALNCWFLHRAPIVTAVRAGGLAVQYPDIVPGLVLTEVQGVLVKNFDYQTAVDLMKGAERPLTLKFIPVWPL